MEFSRSVLRGIATLLFIIAIPIALIATDIRLLAFDPSLYEQSQIRFGGMRSIGLSREQVRATSVSLVNYFTAGTGSLASELQKQGLPGDFFNSRETVHLHDVKDLLARVIVVQQLALGYVALFLGASFLFSRSELGQRTARQLLWSGGAMLLVLLTFAALTYVDFSSMSLVFHLISFSNDLWILDPETDVLIRIFPPQALFDASMRMATYAVLQSVGLLVIGTGLLVYSRSSAR
jgi:integral membrane protein (TIGR01906 family)